MLLPVLMICQLVELSAFLEHCKIWVHGFCYFSHGVWSSSLCETIFLSSVTAIHTPSCNLPIKKYGFKASVPSYSPWRNKHLLLFCSLPTLFFNVGITAMVSCCPRSRGCSLNNPWKQKSGFWLVETMHFSLKRFIESVGKKATFFCEGKSYLQVIKAFCPDLKALCDRGISCCAHWHQWCICTPGSCTTYHNYAPVLCISLCTSTWEMPILQDPRHSCCTGHSQHVDVNDAEREEISHPTSSLSVRK